MMKPLKSILVIATLSLVASAFTSVNAAEVWPLESVTTFTQYRGAGITHFSINMMKEYGLSQAGYEFFTGTEGDCFSAFENAIATNTWCVVTL
nr:glycine betaine ABC transporter substrate-binding protein [Colwellia sp. M166]|tara:strand:+ start:11980 stop:12258 length:279 start_codon:yes stop_codon:yes gene_type:complete